MSTSTASVKRGAALACAAAVATVAASLVSVAAEAAPGAQSGGARKPDRCVTMGEYDKVSVHQTRSSVHRSFGTSGHRTSIAHHGPRTDEVRTYDVCHSPDSTVTVSYRRGKTGPFRVLSKTAVWVD
jgi:hypothetical protein